MIDQLSANSETNGDMPPVEVTINSQAPSKGKQESCAIAKMTAQCAVYTGALKIFGTP